MASSLTLLPPMSVLDIIDLVGQRLTSLGNITAGWTTRATAAITFGVDEMIHGGER